MSGGGGAGNYHWTPTPCHVSRSSPPHNNSISVVAAAAVVVVVVFSWRKRRRKEMKKKKKNKRISAMLDESSRKRRGVLRNALTGFVEACRVEGGGHGGGRGGVSCLPACLPANFQESNRQRISRNRTGCEFPGENLDGFLESWKSSLHPSSFLLPHPPRPPHPRPLLSEECQDS